MSGQLSLFSVEEQAPAVVDVEGLLLGGGALVRRGDAARISVVLRRGWRSTALVAAFDDRGLGGEVSAYDGDHDGGRCSVRSGFDARLLPVALSWTAGARTALPSRWVLDPARLRMWAMACGRRDHAGYLLRLGPSDEHLWAAAGAALSAAGVAGAFLGARAGGPAYRIVGGRRLSRLAEMLGDEPPGCAEDGWPR